MFSAISSNEVQELIELGTKYKTANAAMATLCYDRAFKNIPPLHTSSPKQMSSKLLVIGVFVRGIVQLLDVEILHDSVPLSRLTGFSAAIDTISLSRIPDRYRIYHGSIIIKRLDLIKDKDLDVERVGRDFLVLGTDLNVALRMICETRVRNILIGVCDNMLKAPLRTCLDVAVDPGVCKRESTCEYDHAKDLTIATFRHRLQIIFQVFEVLDSMRSVSWPAKLNPWPRDTRRQWLNRIHSAMFPLWYQFGNDQVVHGTKLIPKREESIAIMNGWIEAYVRELDPVTNSENAKSFLSEVVAVTMLSFRISPNPTYFAEGLPLHSPRPDLTPKHRETSIVSEVIKFYRRENASALISGTESFQ